MTRRKIRLRTMTYAQYWTTCNVCEDGWDEDCTDPKWPHGVHIDHPVKPFSLCRGCYEAVVAHCHSLSGRVDILRQRLAALAESRAGSAPGATTAGKETT